MKLQKIKKSAICKTCGEPSYEFYIIDKDLKGNDMEICTLCKKKIDLMVESIGNRIIKETRADERKRRES